MAKLSKRMIDDAQPAGADVFLWDTTLPGFGLRVKPTGVKSFIIQYRTRERRSRRFTIGRYGKLTLDDARKEAARLLRAVTLGGDPAGERGDMAASPTVDNLGDQYMRAHCAGRCKASTIAQHEWLLKKFISPELGARKVRGLSRSDVEALHQKLATTPYNANRVLGLLKTMLNHAEQWGLRDAGTNPTRLVKKYRETKKQRYLSLVELKRLTAAIAEAQQLGSITKPMATALRLLILTGCRLNEILSLRWTAVDLHAGNLLLAQHKTDNHGPKVVPLSRQAIRILRTTKRIDGNPFVIVGGNEGEHLINLQKPWRNIRRTAGLSDVRLHDLRHSFASFGAAAGISLPLIGGLLGHNDHQSTARYTHLAQEPLRVAAEAIGKSIAGSLSVRAHAPGSVDRCRSARGDPACR